MLLNASSSDIFFLFSYCPVFSMFRVLAVGEKKGGICVVGLADEGSHLNNGPKPKARTPFKGTGCALEAAKRGDYRDIGG